MCEQMCVYFHGGGLKKLEGEYLVFHKVLFTGSSLLYLYFDTKKLSFSQKSSGGLGYPSY